MGCGCAKKRGVNGEVISQGAFAGRKAVYQVVKDGQVVSEFGTPMEARKAATEAGGRVRITSQPM
jgi:hypothetical protein